MSKPSSSARRGSSRAGLSSQVLGNLQSGITVALVNIPLSISLAVAANATPLMGIITAVWAGLAATAFGGSKFNIVGPTGALSGVLAAYAITHGMETLPMLAVATGILTLVAFALKWDKYIVFIPASVVHGFTLGVAFIIALNQLNFALGLSGLPTHETFIANVIETLRHASLANPAAAGVFLAGLAFLLLWNRIVPRFPGAIILAPIGIVLGTLSARGTLPLALQTLSTRFGDFHATLFQWPTFTFGAIDRPFVSTAITVTVIAILETLISAKIADGMTHTKFDKRKEVFGLGLANIASGLTGGIPATAALARTALNVKSGATSKMSAGLNCLVTGLISLVFLQQFKFLPLAVVAAILVFTAYRMVQGEHFAHLYRHDKAAFWLSMIVAAVTVIYDPIIGILLGASVALLLFVRKLSKGQAEIFVNKKGKVVSRLTFALFHRHDDHGDVLVYRFAGPLTYVNSLAHLEAIQRIKGPHSVILALRNLFYIDVDGLDSFGEMVETLEDKGMRVAFSGVNDLILPILKHSPAYLRKKKQNLLFVSTSDAVKRLEKKLGK